MSIVKILTGAGVILNDISTNLTNKGLDLIDSNLLKDKYVSQEDFDKLQHIVSQLKEELEKLKK